MFQEALTFDDVILEPQYSEVQSRTHPDISRKLRGLDRNFWLPVISSPMDTVTEAEMVIAMGRAGGLGIIHRYNTIEEQVNICKRIVELEGDEFNDWGAAIGASSEFVGTNPVQFIERAEALYDAGTNIFCIDVAHGHHIFVKLAIKKLRDMFGSNIHIMAGNVATARGFADLAEWGADSIRVGIGGGSICSTRLNTGHGIPNLSSIQACYEVFKGHGPALIIDGGIRGPGDIVKALAAGADFVMCGSLLAGTDEAPGEVLNVDGKKVKEYRGMASREAQHAWRGTSSAAEGISTIVPYKGPVKPVLEDLSALTKAGLSYSGARNIEDFREKAKFVKQSAASVAEAYTHILNR
jgi:IMP dehydrogenase